MIARRLGDSIDSRRLGITPERVEYETMSEAEESEFEQTQHNLSASLLSLDFDEDEESDSDDEYVFYVTSYFLLDTVK